MSSSIMALNFNRKKSCLSIFNLTAQLLRALTKERVAGFGEVFHDASQQNNLEIKSFSFSLKLSEGALFEPLDHVQRILLPLGLSKMQ